jgi:hypothetical protein
MPLVPIGSLWKKALRAPTITQSATKAFPSAISLPRSAAVCLNVPVVSKSPEEASAHFDWLAHFVAIDCPASCAKTQQQLAWRPTQVGLIPDLDHGTYFDAGQTKHATQSHG